MNKKIKQYNAFTLAEVLITLGVIGIVAAVTMPTLVTNIQERVRKEQVRTVKYKLTKATDKMNSLGKIKQYDTTMDFVNELKKHMTIAKICKNNELDKCWPSTEINAYSGSGTTLTSYNPKNLQKGESLKALALSTKNTQTVGIVTGDGVPMLMVYSPSPHCNDFDEAKTYTWSVEDGKPVTNATTNCISAIFDINGAKGPNKIGTDVRTLNSLFGSTDLGNVTGISSEQCNKVRTKYGINECCTDCDANGGDTWAAGVIKCANMGLHLPDMMTLANIANSRYGTSLIGPYTMFMGSNHTSSQSEDCKNWIKNNLGSRFLNGSDTIICNANTNPDPLAGFSISGDYWSGLEYSSIDAYERLFYDDYSFWYTYNRTNTLKSLCVGD